MVDKYPTVSEEEGRKKDSQGEKRSDECARDIELVRDSAASINFLNSKEHIVAIDTRR